MSNRSETFGRLIKGAINSIAAYEGKTAPAVEDELGAQIGVTGAAIQRYKAGYLPPEPRTVAILAEAAVRRGYLSRAWLARFLQAARYANTDALIAQLADVLMPAGAVHELRLPSGTLALGEGVRSRSPRGAQHDHSYRLRHRVVPYDKWWTDIQ